MVKVRMQANDMLFAVPALATNRNEGRVRVSHDQISANRCHASSHQGNPCQAKRVIAQVSRVTSRLQFQLPTVFLPFLALSSNMRQLSTQNTLCQPPRPSLPLASAQLVWIPSWDTDHHTHPPFDVHTAGFCKASYEFFLWNELNLEFIMCCVACVTA